MLTLLELTEHQKVLEIGAGAGYGAALLASAYPTSQYYGLEINLAVAIESAKRLESYKNIHLFPRSGFKGFPEQAPFDRILVSAAAESIEVLLNLLPQVKDNGIILGPIGEKLIHIRKTSHSPTITEHPGAPFVPLLKDE
jgi:protein-L-isoaspartate(D-aspartate) O-methyltransferase